MEDIIIRSEIRQNFYNKFAIFDFDWTLVKPKDGRTFPKNIEDWQYLRSSVPSILLKFVVDHNIVIVTDHRRLPRKGQTKKWKVEQIINVVKNLNIEEYTVLIGFKTKKPSVDLFFKAFPSAAKYNFSAFYVGDAAGRKGDCPVPGYLRWSDVDADLAYNLGVNFYVPEQVFAADTDKINSITIETHTEREVVIMVGYPASGKTTVANILITQSNDGYYRIDGDTLKTPAKMGKV